MAESLNTFRSYHKEITTTEEVVYTAPLTVTTVVLLAQAANVSSTGASITFKVRDNSVDPAVDTELASEYIVAPNDSAGLLTGKLVVEAGNALVASSDSNSNIKLSISLLETLNES